MDKITKLTVAQTKIMEEVSGHWIKYILGGDDSINRKVAKEGIEWIYSLAKLKKPVVLFVDSPLAAQCAIPIYNNLVKSGKRQGVSAQVRAQVHDQVYDQVNAQVHDQVDDQVGAQVYDQVDDQVRGQVSRQVDDQVDSQVREQVSRKVNAQVYDQVDDQVNNLVSDQVRAQVVAQVDEQVNAKVTDQVRAQVGDQVNDQVTDQVDGQVGSQVVAQVDEQVNAKVNDQVYAQVNDQVRAKVGDQVSDQVDDQVEDQVNHQVSDQVYDQVNDQVHGQVSRQVRVQVRNQVNAKVHGQVSRQVDDQVDSQVREQVSRKVNAQVYDQVDDQVNNLVSDQVRAQVRNQVTAQVDEEKLVPHRFSWESLGWSTGLASFIDYYQKIGVIKHKAADKWLKYLKSGAYATIFVDGLAVVCRRPTKVNRDEQNRLHSTDEAAISWRDGYKIHAIHGVRFENNLETWEKIRDGKLTAKEAIGIKDIDQRMCAIKHLGPKDMITALKAKLVDSGEMRLYKHLPERHIKRVAVGHGHDVAVQNRLYEVTDFFREGTKYFLHYKDPSTKNDYLSFCTQGVEKRGKDADAVQGWKHGMSKQSYLGMILEA